MSVCMCVFFLSIFILFSYNSHGVRNDHLKDASANQQNKQCFDWLFTTRQNCTLDILRAVEIPKRKALNSIKKLNKNQKVSCKITKTIVESLVSLVG